MFKRPPYIFLILICILFGGAPGLAQTGVESKSTVKSGEADDDNHPTSFKETLFKLRIDKEKKDFGAMLSRGGEALKLSEELEKAYSINGRLNAQELNKLVAVEKLVKKIRSELGGDDDSETRDDQEGLQSTSLGQGDAVKSFRSTTSKLLEELKKPAALLYRRLQYRHRTLF